MLDYEVMASYLRRWNKDHAPTVLNIECSLSNLFEYLVFERTSIQYIGINKDKYIIEALNKIYPEEKIYMQDYTDLKTEFADYVYADMKTWPRVFLKDIKIVHRLSTTYSVIRTTRNTKTEALLTSYAQRNKGILHYRNTTLILILE